MATAWRGRPTQLQTCAPNLAPFLPRNYQISTRIFNWDLYGLFSQLSLYLMGKLFNRCRCIDLFDSYHCIKLFNGHCFNAELNSYRYKKLFTDYRSIPAAK